MAEKANSTPRPPVSSRTASTGRRAVASTTSVAPRALACSSFSGATSTATIRSAPASKAPCTTASPTPPQPITATVDPFLHGRSPEGGSRSGREAAREERRLLDRQLAPASSPRRPRARPRGRRTSRSAAPASAARRRWPGAAAASRGAARSTDEDRPVGTAGSRRTARARPRRRGRRARPRSRRCPSPRRRPLPRARAGSGTGPPSLRLDDVEVGVTEPAGEDADEHLARPRRVDGELLNRRRRVGLGVDDAARHGLVTVAATGLGSVTSRVAAVRRAGRAAGLNVSTALGSVTTLSPSASIVSWSRVTGAPGRRSVNAACSRIALKGTWTDGRRTPSARFSRSQNSFQRHRVRAAELERPIRPPRLGVGERT